MVVKVIVLLVTRVFWLYYSSVTQVLHKRRFTISWLHGGKDDNLQVSNESFTKISEELEKYV